MPQYRFDYKALQEMRQAHGLRAELVAIATGATNQAVISWENGRAIPKTASLIALCVFFECSPNDLLVHVADEMPKLAEDHRKKSRRAQGLADRSQPAALDDAAEILKLAKAG